MARNAVEKLDAQIAVKVMGYSLWKNFLKGDYEGEYPMWNEGNLYDDPESGDVTDRFEPSTDIESAMRVVERMRQLGFSCMIRLWSDEYGFDKSNVIEFNCPYGPCRRHGNKFANNHGSGEVEAKTLETAICKAALKAVAIPRRGHCE